MAKYVHNIHGLLRVAGPSTGESWRGGTYSIKGARSATPQDFASAARNAREYGPDKQVVVARWYETWIDYGI